MPAPYYTTYQKTVSDRMGVIESQAALHIPFDFHFLWTELRACLLCSMTGVGGDNEPWVYTGPRGVHDTPEWMFSCGFKDSLDLLPGAGGSKFIGYTLELLGSSPALFANPGPNGGYIAGTGVHFLRGAYIGTTKVEGALNDYSFAVSGPTASVNATNYNARHTFSLRVVDRGLATQALKLFVKNISATGGDSNGTELECHAAIDDLIIGVEEVTIPWQSGGTPYALPTKFFLHTPFLPERLRVSNFVLKVMS